MSTDPYIGISVQPSEASLNGTPGIGNYFPPEVSLDGTTSPSFDNPSNNFPTGSSVLAVSWEIIIPFIVVSAIVVLALFFCCWNSRKAELRRSVIAAPRAKKYRSEIRHCRGSIRSTTPLELASKYRADYIIPQLRRSPVQYGHLRIELNNNALGTPSGDETGEIKRSTSFIHHYENKGFQNDPLDTADKQVQQPGVKTMWRSEPNISEHDPFLTNIESDPFACRNVTSEPIISAQMNDPFFPNFNTPVRTSGSSLSNELDIGIINYSNKSRCLYSVTPFNTPVDSSRKESPPSSDSTVNLSNPKFPSIASRPETPDDSYDFVAKLDNLVPEGRARSRIGSEDTIPPTRSGSLTPYPNSSHTGNSSRCDSGETSSEHSADLQPPRGAQTSWQYSSIFTSRGNRPASNSQCNVTCTVDQDSNSMSMNFPSNNTSMFPAIGSGNTSICPLVGSTNTSDQQPTTSGNASAFHSTTGLGSEVTTSASTSDHQHSAPGFEHEFCSAEGISQIVISSIEGSMSNSPKKPKTSTANTSSAYLQHNPLTLPPKEETDVHAHMVYKQKKGRPASLVVQVTHDSDGNHKNGYNGKVSIIQWDSPNSAPALIESQMPNQRIFSWWPQPILAKKQYWV